MRLHLPLSEQKFFLSHAKDSVEVRANFYEEAEFAQTKADEYFNIRPSYDDDDAQEKTTS